jgi:hypothetical protein
LKRNNADLVLIQMPLERLAQSHILANDQRASLITPTSSYQLVTQGTSNTYVVWKHKQKSSGIGANNSTDDQDDDPDAPSPQKKLKSGTVQACRLVNPGGSGSSFMVGQTPPPLTASDIVPYLKQSGQQYTTLQLAQRLQYSEHEIEQVLAQLPVIWIDDCWLLLEEDAIWQAQAAVVQTMCEEENDVLVSEDQLVPLIAQRLHGDQYTTAMARKFLQLASTSQEASKTVSVDPNKVRTFTECVIAVCVVLPSLIHLSTGICMLYVFCVFFSSKLNTTQRYRSPCGSFKTCFGKQRLGRLWKTSCPRGNPACPWETTMNESLVWNGCNRKGWSWSRRMAVSPILVNN